MLTAPCINTMIEGRFEHRRHLRRIPREATPDSGDLGGRGALMRTMGRATGLW